MRTIPVTLRDMVTLGMYGESWQTFVDNYEEKFNAITIDGFEFDPVTIGYTWAQMLSKVGAQVLPTYVDPESEGYEKPLGQMQGNTGNIPTQKLFYSVNRVILREKMQLVQKYGTAVMDDEMREVMFGLLDEGTDGLIQSFWNALNHQRHQIVSKGEFTIDGTNNPRGYKGVTISFNMPGVNKEILVGEKQWWKDADHTTEGSQSDPLGYMADRIKWIRRVSHYNGPIKLELSRDMWDDLLKHSKVTSVLANWVYRNIASDSVRADVARFADEDLLKDAIRRIIKADEVAIQETYAFVSKPGTDANGLPDLVEERIDNFDPQNIAFIPTGKLGGIQGVQPLSMGYDADKVAYAMGNRLLIEQEDIPRTHSINVNGEMAQLCVPNAILHMYISTVAPKTNPSSSSSASSSSE